MEIPPPSSYHDDRRPRRRSRSPMRRDWGGGRRDYRRRSPPRRNFRSDRGSRDWGRGRQRRRRRSPSLSSDSSGSQSPPRRRKPEESKWDKPPAGMAPIMGGNVPPAAQAAAAAAAAQFSGVHPSRLAQLGGAPPMNPMLAMPMAGGMADQSTRQARRLYVGNLPQDTHEEEVKQFFCHAMEAANEQHVPGPAVTSVYLNLAKKFGFVEFRTMEECTAAMDLDGITFKNNVLKCRRPSDYNAGMFPAPQKVIRLNVAKLGIISTQVPDSAHKVFCGGLPYDLGEAEVKELLQVYGALKAFHLVRERDSDTSKGYCFFEYLDPGVTDTAVKGLNGIEIGSKTLTVRRAQARGDMPSSNMDMGIVAPLIPNLNAMADFQTPSTVICLLQAVVMDDLKDDQEYKEICEDIEFECKKYGDVQRVVIPRPNPDGSEVPGVEKVFVKFNAVPEAIRAKQALEGRKFANRTVLVQFIKEEDFEAGKF